MIKMIPPETLFSMKVAAIIKKRDILHKLNRFWFYLIFYLFYSHKYYYFVIAIIFYLLWLPNKISLQKVDPIDILLKLTKLNQVIYFFKTQSMQDSPLNIKTNIMASKDTKNKKLAGM